MRSLFPFSVHISHGVTADGSRRFQPADRFYLISAGQQRHGKRGRKQPVVIGACRCRQVVLQLVEIGIDPATGQQFGMGTTFNDPSLCHDNDLIKALDARELMGDDQHRFAPLQVVDRRID